MAKRTTKNRAALAPIIPIGEIEQRILLIRGQRVILAADLARMYGVPVKQLNQAIGRNAGRFPDDFVFQLTPEESDALTRYQSGALNEPDDLRSQIVTSNNPKTLRSQTVISKTGRGGTRYLPYAFTEHGAIMAANLLRSPQAVKVSVYVVRAFVKLRELLSNHRELAVKLGELESKLQNHDEQIISLINAIRSLMTEPPKSKPPIGYHTESKRRK